MFFAAILCVAEAIYFEARNQQPAGQIAVAQVIQHRVADPRYPDNECDVIRQPKHFEYYWDGKPERFTNQEAYNKALWYAFWVKVGIFPDYVQQATHYDGLPERPPWFYGFEIRIEDHVFYRAK